MLDAANGIQSQAQPILRLLGRPKHVHRAFEVSPFHDADAKPGNGVSAHSPVAARSETRLRLDGFNALNHPNFADPVKFLDSPLFGRSTSLLNMELGSAALEAGLVLLCRPVFPEKCRRPSAFTSSTKALVR
jgi:hypothetical protein